MWYKVGNFILKNRVFLLVFFSIALLVGVFFASKIQLSYDFTKAIPTDNPKYQAYQNFLKQFGSDGNTMVVGFNDTNIFTIEHFNEIFDFTQKLKAVPDIQSVISLNEAVILTKDSNAEKLIAARIFSPPYDQIDSLQTAATVFQNQPFYRNLFYNPATAAYLIAIQLNKDTLNSDSRTRLIESLKTVFDNFETTTKIPLYISGLPYIRVEIGNQIKAEMKWLLVASFLLSALVIFVFFRSMAAVGISILVVLIGVVGSLATMVLLGYKITLLTALIPPLLVVIGIPNCVYFFNKYHTAYLQTKDKTQALMTMLGKMSIVTLFCNIAAAIGFIVFAFTKSELLKEFGIVAAINILLLFLISLVLIPILLNFLPAPKTKEVRYLSNQYLLKIIDRIEYIVFHKQKWVYAISGLCVVFSIVGVFKIKTDAYIVDDLPKEDVIYTDLKWFEENFKGVMPLEITIDTKKKNGLIRSLQPISKIEELSQYIAQQGFASQPLSFVEGLKFAKQAYYDNDSLSYTLPFEGDMAFLAPYLKGNKDSSSAGAKTKPNSLNVLLKGFVDSNLQTARISIKMKDIGSKALPLFLDSLHTKTNQIFDTADYVVTFTGSSITFLEGANFIINGLKESIFYAFLLIALCMLLLFKSLKIVFCSLIPNIIPLLLTAGWMGWMGIRLTPSTVLIFSIALGIVIDVTIRFLINYKQELPHYNYQADKTLKQTIQSTGISILYTSIVLIAGFIIFCGSHFKSTQSLGWLTSLTLLVGTLTNLLLLPILLKSFYKK